MLVPLVLTAAQEAGATVPIFQQMKWRLREGERPAQGHRANDGRPVEAPAAWDRPYQEPGGWAGRWQAGAHLKARFGRGAGLPGAGPLASQQRSP